jgi:hypothetical protein
MMGKLLRWLFPAYFSPYAKCRQCDRVRLKTDMVRDRGYDFDWFCTEEERGMFEEDRQW